MLPINRRMSPRLATASRRVRPASAARLALVCALVAPLAGCDVLCQLFGLPTEVCSLVGQIGGSSTQNLRVAIEVKFLGVEDDFFDRIGVDFDFDIQDNAPLVPANNVGPTPPAVQPQNAFLAPSNLVGGQDNTLMFVPRQLMSHSYFLPTAPDGESNQQVNYFPGLPVLANLPVIGIFDQTGLGNLTGGVRLNSFYNVDAVSFGTALLDDIEASLFIQAAQADTRNGILAAPNLTLFNGQAAAVLGENEPTLINDVSPEFQNALVNADPNIQTVQSGPTFEVIPTISSDRRQVTLTIIPIRMLHTRLDGLAQAEGINRGILFPVIQPGSVQTTVTVPDGGTVLLGGIKTTSGGALQRGVPILNKLPYVNRLFKNVGPIRETHRLMLMVTPRIIINEEE